MNAAWAQHKFRIYQSIRRNIQENLNIQGQRCEQFKTRKFRINWSMSTKLNMLRLRLQEIRINVQHEINFFLVCVNETATLYTHVTATTQDNLPVAAHNAVCICNSRVNIMFDFHSSRTIMKFIFKASTLLDKWEFYVHWCTSFKALFTYLVASSATFCRQTVIRQSL